MALTGPVELKTQNQETFALTSGVATTIYAGATLVTLAAGGVSNVPADVLPFAAFANETKTVAVGDKINCIVGGLVFIPNTNAALTDEGLLLYVDRSAGTDDPSLLTISPESAHDMSCGVIKRADVGVGWWVKLVTVSTVAP